MQHSGLAGIRLSSDCMSCRVSSAIDVMNIPIIGLGVPRSQTMSPHPDNRSYHLYVTLISYRSRGYIIRTGRISRQYIRFRRINTYTADGVELDQPPESPLERCRLNQPCAPFDSRQIVVKFLFPLVLSSGVQVQYHPSMPVTTETG